MVHTNGKVLVSAVSAKIDEQAELLSGIVARLPHEQLQWAPGWPATEAPPPKRTGEVLGHLLQCLAGVLAVLHAAHPDRLAHLMDLKKLPVNHFCTEDEALRRIGDYRRHIREGFDSLCDEDLARIIPTVFVPSGESILTLLLGNLEHIINHKHELFVYAKGQGIPLVSRDLYRFRTQAAAQSAQAVTAPAGSSGPAGSLRQAPTTEERS